MSDNNLTNQTKEEKVKEIKVLKPKNDVVFQRLFNKDNEKITKAFVEALLDVEIQLIERSNLPERLLFYFSKLYLRGIGKGEDYRFAKRVVLIAIIDYNLKMKIENKKMETIWKLIEKDNPQNVLTNKLEIHILELDKVKEEYEKNKKNEKAQWLLFLDNPKVIEVKKLSEDEELQRLADLREKAIMDEKAIYQAGLNNGKTEAMQEVAKKLLKQNVEIKKIAEITGLTIERIEQLKLGD